MGRLSSLISLLSVEVLDSRLESPADEKKRQETVEKAGPVRWRTLEFYVYGVVFAIAVPLMFKAAMDSSSLSNPNFEKYSDLLEPGWMFGRLVDNSDAQYSGFRNNFPYLVGVIIAQLGLRQCADFAGVSRLSFDVVFSILFLTGLYGIGMFKIMLILVLNFGISRIQDRRYAYILTWVFGIGILFLNELTEGYPLKLVHPELETYDVKLGGLMQRWDVNFNFTMLRMVSFNVDYFESRDEAKPGPATPSTSTPERDRIRVPMHTSKYSFWNYLAYAIYAPLYLAGPILTFNDFIRQSETPLPTINQRFIKKYAVRFVFCFLTMEFLLHYTYVVAISQRRAWEGDSPFQISMIALFNLNVIWLKLLIPWRLFRLWALIDGIDAPENMIRCVNNNYSAMSFWRSWHRSYNRWVLRYIYIPLGGSKRPIVNSLIVFTFVAIWHDIQLHLLFWGWLVVLFIIPEVLATFAFPKKTWGDRPVYRHLCAIGAVANIWMMMIANLIGFCVHLDGMKQMLHDMVMTADGLKYIFVSTCCLFVGAQAMFEFREREKRKGIDMRC
ncbi:hypothetical protein TRICI_000026 [Trichomonascus ciferrii]|uniref:Glycerol uptake protein 1 n=1 Tax=Trichomonascus ciferrii TaxID=44093 RepID=A0A642VEL3_9ASCO|nr:hypothetical protein TRICI_000026 [Trichomonascus ciferrii]